jgi:succinate dehydrogenase / fumarate reductase flavoprotein subunit
LAEILVFGRIVAQHAGEYATAHPLLPLDEEQIAKKRARLAQLRTIDGAAQRAMIDELQQTVWEGAGVVRTEHGLQDALERLADIGARAQASTAGEGDLPAALDLRSMLLTAEATVHGALMRTESRGAHQRVEYPHQDPAWQRTIVIKPGRNGMTLSTVTLPDPSPEVAAVLNDGELTMAGRLVE